MRLLAQCLLLVLPFQVSGLVDENYSFQDFIAEFDKAYADAAEYEQRKVIFEKNLAIILSHNKGANPSQGGHVLGINEFADQEAEELPRGYVKVPSTHSAAVDTSLSKSRRLDELPFALDDVSDLPKEVDWRAAGVTTPVKSQGMCGSCWAFASTAVMESHIAIQTGTLFSLSEQELVSCAPNVKHCGGTGGCAGATAELAFDWFAQKGAVQEWEFGYASYHGETVNCTLSDQPSRSFLKQSAGSATKSTLYKGAVAGIMAYYQLPTNDYQVMMNVLAKHGPVAVSVACLPWHLYQGGVFYAPLNSTRATDVSKFCTIRCSSFRI